MIKSLFEISGHASDVMVKPQILKTHSAPLPDVGHHLMIKVEKIVAGYLFTLQCRSCDIGHGFSIQPQTKEATESECSSSISELMQRADSEVCSCG